MQQRCDDHDSSKTSWGVVPRSSEVGAPYLHDASGVYLQDRSLQTLLGKSVVVDFQDHHKPLPIDNEHHQHYYPRPVAGTQGAQSPYRLGLIEEGSSRTSSRNALQRPDPNEQRSNMSEGGKKQDSKRKGTSSKPELAAIERRQVFDRAASATSDCICIRLPPRFPVITEDPKAALTLCGGNLTEYYAHILQIIHCRGDHPNSLTTTCEKLRQKMSKSEKDEAWKLLDRYVVDRLLAEQRPKPQQGSKSSSTRLNASQPVRGQRTLSSIPPDEFYGYETYVKLALSARRERKEKGSSSAPQAPASRTQTSMEQRPQTVNSTDFRLQENARANGGSASARPRADNDEPSSRHLGKHDGDKESDPSPKKRKKRRLQAPVDEECPEKSSLVDEQSPAHRNSRDTGILQDLGSLLKALKFGIAEYTKKNTLQGEKEAPPPAAKATSSERKRGSQDTADYLAQDPFEVVGKNGRMYRVLSASDFPAAQRWSDEDLIRIGRSVNGYQRHRRAPQAFNVYGVVEKAYEYLFTRAAELGIPWTPKEIRRLTKRVKPVGPNKLVVTDV